MAINSISCLAVQLLFISLCSVSVNTLKAALGSHRKPNLFTFRSSIADIHTWSPRIQKIKNLSLHKDILRDITASEFALRLESAHPKKDQIVDFDRLISKLDADLFLIERRRAVFADSENLISRILRVREDLLLASQNLPLRNTEFILTEPFETIPTTEVDAVPTEGNNKLKMKELRDSLRIRVREDGTVDWDGTLATGKEIAKFGAELWERLNGKEEGVPTFAQIFGQAQEKGITTPEIESMTRLVREAQQDVVMRIRERENAKSELRKSRREGLLASKESIQDIKRMDLEVKELSKRAKLLSLNLDLEKICAFLQKELEGSVEPSELRGLVAEVSLIDRQLSGVISSVDLGILGSGAAGSAAGADTAKNSADQTVNFEALLLVDENEVSLISTAVQDLKSRLGIDTQQLLPTMDWGSLGTFVKENINRIKTGITFFKEGTSLLVSDVQYAWLLFRKAIRGYTLKPREVNAVRRAGRDLLTLIPFTIILIVPLTPIGHVLVFTFIQRYFPDFFPSCYTEKRLNLKRLFSEVERRSEEQEVGSLLDRAVAHPHERGLVRDFSLGKFMSGGSNGGGSGGGGLGSMGYGLFRTNAWGSPSSNTNDDNSSGPAAAQSAGKETGTLLGLNASAMVQAMRWSNLRRAIDKLVQVVQAEEREPAPTPTSVAAEDASSTAESESGAVDSKEDNKAPPVF